jgi:D-alanyl-D-alanine carboxypeptidase
MAMISFETSVFAAADIMEITRDAGYTDVLEVNKPKASIVIDGVNGQILWEENAEVVREPASISKMMTVFLVFDAIKEGKLTLDTPIKATEKDQAISQLYAISNNDIEAGVEYPVRELLKMVIVPSSNVATVMLANIVSANDAGGFIKRMNDKAQKNRDEEYRLLQLQRRFCREL